jgi:hypothetical protein
MNIRERDAERRERRRPRLESKSSKKPRLALHVATSIARQQFQEWLVQEWLEKRRAAARGRPALPSCVHCGHVRPASPDIRTDVDGRPVCAFCLSDGLGGSGEELGLFRTYARDWRRWCWSCDQMAREGR